MGAEMVRYPDDGMGLAEAIAAYLAACEVEGKSPRTVDAYAETLGMFHAICLQKGLPARVATFRPAHVYAFLKVIADRGVSLGTRHRRFRETRAFFSWCTRMGGCAASPFTGIPNVKVEQKVIQPLSEEEIQALLDVCNPAEEFGCRNRAIILLFLDTGMRYTELHRLTLADVSWGDPAHPHPSRQGAHAAGGALRGWPGGGTPRLHRPLPWGGWGAVVSHDLALGGAAAPDEPILARDALRPARPAGRRARQPPPLPPHLRHLGD